MWSKREEGEKNPGNVGILTAVLLILAFATVDLAVTAEDAWNAAAGVGTFELAGQANMNVCGEIRRRLKMDEQITLKEFFPVYLLLNSEG